MSETKRTTIKNAASSLLIALMTIASHQAFAQSPTPDNMSSAPDMQNYPAPAGGSGKATLTMKVLPGAQLDGTLSLSAGPISASAEAQIGLQFTADGRFRALCNYGRFFDLQANKELNLTVKTDPATGKYSISAQFEGQRSFTVADNCYFRPYRRFPGDLVINNLGLQATSGVMIVRQVNVTVDFSLLPSWSDICAALHLWQAKVNSIIRGIVTRIDLVAAALSNIVINVDATRTVSVSVGTLQASTEGQMHIEVDGHDISGPMYSSQLTATPTSVEYKALLVMPKGKHSVEVVVDSGDIQPLHLTIQ